MTIEAQQSYTPKQAAALLSISLNTIYRMINDNQIDSFLFRKSRRIVASEIVRIQTGH
jgi:excisionase family DNA binding protein